MQETLETLDVRFEPERMSRNDNSVHCRSLGFGAEQPLPKR